MTSWTKETDQSTSYTGVVDVNTDYRKVDATGLVWVTEDELYNWVTEDELYNWGTESSVVVWSDVADQSTSYTKVVDISTSYTKVVDA